ncbi:MAG: trigger factor, partial [bacterium]
MKTHIESINSVSKKVTVTFDGKLCEDVQNTVLKKAQAQAVISGFRKGKVPFEILKQRFGNALKSEVQQELISKALEHLKDEDKLNIVALSKAKFNELDKDQTVEMEVELQPEFELPDYKNFKLDEAKIEVSEAEVKDFIERLQKQQASYDVVDRPAKSKDYVKLSYSGTVDGRPVDDFPGIPHIWATQKTTWEEVDATDEIGIPEIVQGIKGLKAGDVKAIKVKFPKTFAVKELQQKEAIYSVEIAEVREVKLPELNEAFFKQLQVKDLEELHQFAEKTIRSRKEQEFAAQQKQ